VPRWVASRACSGFIASPRSPDNSPAIAVTTVASPLPRPGAVSQTAHAETALPEIARSSGIPAMPMIGPVGYLLISVDFTQVGDPALPVARRAEVRLSAG